MAMFDAWSRAVGTDLLASALSNAFPHRYQYAMNAIAAMTPNAMVVAETHRGCRVTSSNTHVLSTSAAAGRAGIRAVRGLAAKVVDRLDPHTEVGGQLRDRQDDFEGGGVRIGGLHDPQVRGRHREPPRPGRAAPRRLGVKGSSADFVPTSHSVSSRRSLELPPDLVFWWS